MGILENIFMGGKHLPVTGGIESVIGENARIKGELFSKGAINISGEFEGKINAQEVIISPSGKVTGEVQGGNVVVSGKVEGNVKAAGNLEITKTGKVHGDLTGGRIIIDEGAAYHGKVKVENKKAEEHEKDEEKAKIVEEKKVEEAVLADTQNQPFPNF